VIASVWAARYLGMNGRRRLIGSFGHGSMANAMLQAIGAQAAQPDVVTAKQELSMPPTITPEQIKGLSLGVLRVVMNGRGDEVLDLAKTNLLPR